jgi:hypothetical protein
MQRFQIPTAVGLALLGLGAGWMSPNPAVAEDPQDQQAQVSFERFAGMWMKKMRDHEAAARRKPKLGPVAFGEALASYRGYGRNFQVELRPTGEPSAPYVGLLRYTEYLYGCADTQGESCSVTSEVPVTEIFRMKDGRWIY